MGKRISEGIKVIEVAFIVAVVALLVVVVGYPSYLLVSAFLEVKGSPREEMVFCQKHGPLRKSNMVMFMEQEVCPTCLHEKLKSAEQGKL